MATELTEGLHARGHVVDVVTTSLRSIGEPPEGRLRTRFADVNGVDVSYAATLIRYRWIGVTPSLPLVLRRLPRPDVVHIFGYRDAVTSVTAWWARLLGIPMVFEPLGMFEARLRK